MTQADPPERELAFATARDNFYAAAQQGLDAHIAWLKGRRGSIQALLAEQLLPQARAGLTSLEIDAADIERYLGIIEARVRSGQTGSAWQRAWVARHGRDMTALTHAYRQRQDSQAPVHEWSLE
jgi:hypothetical protein